MLYDGGLSLCGLYGGRSQSTLPNSGYTRDVTIGHLLFLFNQQLYSISLCLTGINFLVNKHY